MTRFELIDYVFKALKKADATHPSRPLGAAICAQAREVFTGLPRAARAAQVVILALPYAKGCSEPKRA
jgi:hypothetical protein